MNTVLDLEIKETAFLMVQKNVSGESTDNTPNNDQGSEMKELSVPKHPETKKNSSVYTMVRQNNTIENNEADVIMTTNH